MASHVPVHSADYTANSLPNIWRKRFVYHFIVFIEHRTHYLSHTHKSYIRHIHESFVRCTLFLNAIVFDVALFRITVIAITPLSTTAPFSNAVYKSVDS